MSVKTDYSPVKLEKIMSRGDVPPLAWSVLPEFITQAPANIFASFVT